jgi:hypothetical protein
MYPTLQYLLDILEGFWFMYVDFCRYISFTHTSTLPLIPPPSIVLQRTCRGKNAKPGIF